MPTPLLRFPVSLWAASFVAVLSIIALNGCGTGAGGKNSGSPGALARPGAISGVVYGGQQAIVGASVQLYAANTSGTGTQSRAMLSPAVTTLADGSFNVTGLYTCNTGDQVYLVATGGNAGGGVNGAIALAAALGPCATIKANAATTKVTMNEVTTVAAVYALANFMVDAEDVSSTADTASTDLLAAAFANANTYADLATGAALATTIGNGIVPQTLINSLANSLAACVNSPSGSSAECSALFKATTVTGSTPVDTLQAALNLAHFPATDPSDVFGVGNTQPPFQPTLSSAPANYAITVSHPSDVLTYHYDVGRTGVQPYETTLTPTNVTSAQFGKKFSFTVDGYLYAQLLYVGGYGMPDGVVRNVLYAATAHGTVYAFDADGNNPAQGYLWKQSLLATGETQVLQADYGGCGDTVPESSLLGTPVIDRTTGTLYVVTTEKVVATGAYTEKIHALSLVDGAEKFNGPTVITATYPGTGAGAVNKVLTFDAIKQNQRPALLLSGGTVWISWSSHCDFGPYHGYVMGYSAADVSKQTVLFNNTPNGSDGGIWMSGGGPAADSQGYVYVVGGNGSFDANTGGLDYGDTGLKLAAPTGGSTLPTVVDYFTPYNQATLNSTDQDVGVTNALIFNDPNSGVAPTLMIESDKTGKIYLLNTSKMGTYDTGPGGTTNGDIQDWATGGAIFNNFAYFDGSLYAGSDGKPIEQYLFTSGTSTTTGSFNTNAISQSMSATAGGSGAGGSSPVVSANGTANGIVWTQDHTGTALLHAYSALNLADELYNSGQATGGRDTMPTPVKFTSPVVVNGKVYVGGVQSIAVYGMLP